MRIQIETRAIRRAAVVKSVPERRANSIYTLTRARLLLTTFASVDVQSIDDTWTNTCI